MLSLPLCRLKVNVKSNYFVWLKYTQNCSLGQKRYTKINWEKFQNQLPFTETLSCF